MQKLSSIVFRHKIHSIKTMEDFTNCKEYIAQFVKNKYQNNKEYVDRFLKELYEAVSAGSDKNKYETLERIKIWILTYIDMPSGKALLGNDPESTLYNFLHFNYTETEGIDMTFNDFYQNYINTIGNPLNKNHVSRALNALGINPRMKKIKLGDGRRKCTMMIQVTREELSEILKKNGLIATS